MESINRDIWLSIGEAAAYLKVSVSFLRKQVRQQRIPFARAGGKVLRFRRELLDAWLASNGSGELSHPQTEGR